MPFVVLTLWSGCAAQGVGCEDRCLDMEAQVAEQAVEADSSATFDQAAWERLCADSRSLGCDECQAATASYMLATYFVSTRCGCGNDLEGVRECTQDQDVTQEEADEVLDQCAQECEAYLL